MLNQKFGTTLTLATVLDMLAGPFQTVVATLVANSGDRTMDEEKGYDEADPHTHYLGRSKWRRRQRLGVEVR